MDKIDSLFVRCRDENGYQRRLDLLLADVRRRTKVCTVVLPDSLTLFVYFGQFYYVERRSYWACEYYFESYVYERQKIFGAWHSVVLSA